MKYVRMFLVGLSAVSLVFYVFYLIDKYLGMNAVFLLLISVPVIPLCILLGMAIEDVYKNLIRKIKV